MNKNENLVPDPKARYIKGEKNRNNIVEKFNLLFAKLNQQPNIPLKTVENKALRTEQGKWMAIERKKISYNLK